jgi:hypothetical protein
MFVKSNRVENQSLESTLGQKPTFKKMRGLPHPCVAWTGGPPVQTFGGLLDYRGWPRRRLHNPRAESMRENIPVTPSA